jgi:hypothetical protein
MPEAQLEVKPEVKPLWKIVIGRSSPTEIIVAANRFDQAVEAALSILKDFHKDWKDISKDDILSISKTIDVIYVIA